MTPNPESHVARFDQISERSLRNAGSVKWSMYPDAIGAWVAEMDFGIAPEIAAAITAALADGRTGYLPPALSHDVAQSTSAWYEAVCGWTPDPNHIHPVPDVIAAYEWAITTLTSPGAAVIVPTPAYMPFLTVPERLGRRVIQVPSTRQHDRYAIDLEATARGFDDGGELFVLCNPHNPLGTVATRDELGALADLVANKGGRVFADEIHAPLVYAPAAHIPYASISPVAARHAITATSASKAWNLAGLKCAQVIVTNEQDAAAWDADGGWAGHGTSTLGAIATVAAFQNGESWLSDVLEYLDGNRALLVELLREHAPLARLPHIEGTYIALIDLRAYGIEGDTGAWFREHAKVAMTDGAACGVAGAGHARFVFALPRPLLIEAVQRIGRALREHAAA